MKKKNRFLANKTFVVFSILAVCIILTAVFAPVVTRGVDPLKVSLVSNLWCCCPDLSGGNCYRSPCRIFRRCH